MRLVGPLGIGLVASLAAGGGLHGQPVRILRGQVTDSAYRPVVLAEIVVLGTGLKADSDTLGLFRISGVPPGIHPIVVRAIGWKPLFFMIRMEDDQEQIVRVGLERRVQQLEELTVEGRSFAKPAEYAFTTKYDEFFRRRRVRSGTFRDRHDLLFRSSFYTADLLRAIPGVSIRYGLEGPMVDFTGCSEAYAKVGVWIDGARVNNPNHNEALNYLRPNDVEFIEVYRRSGQIPGEYLADACAAVIIWTR